MSMITQYSLDALNYDEVSVLIEELKELKRDKKLQKSENRLIIKMSKIQQSEQKRLDIKNRISLKLQKINEKKSSDVTLIDVSEYNKELV